jgi:hypothetical protein
MDHAWPSHTCLVSSLVLSVIFYVSLFEFDLDSYRAGTTCWAHPESLFGLFCVPLAHLANQCQPLPAEGVLWPNQIFAFFFFLHHAGLELKTFEF